MDRLFKTMGPLAALAALGMLAGCGEKSSVWNWDGDGEGVPLAELDLGGEPPAEVALVGPDNVAIVDGPRFAITVDGDAEVAKLLRFKLDGGTLGIMREPGDWRAWREHGVATVRITMPAPRKLTLAGSGRMTSERLAGEAEVSIAGSGTLETPGVDARSLDVSIAGSGTYRAAGRVDKLDLSLAGSGNGEMAGLKAARAEVSIAGSGDATFASDGEVDASIIGSGTVTVRGSARCKVSALGSGSLVCERATETAD